MGWGAFFGKIAEQFQGRVERLKNEKKRLVKKRNDIESGKRGDKDYDKVCDRIKEIQGILETNAKD